MEDEIYRKSGESEAVGVVSGSPLEKSRFREDPASDPIASDAEDASGPKSDALSEDGQPDTKLLMESKARFSISEGVSRGPFAERIEKLRRAIASIMERLSKTED